MKMILESREIPVRGSYDVVVAGAGVAGLAAAVAARRAGRKVLLLEKSCELGGLATLGQINYFVPMCNGSGRQVVRGLCDEFIRLSIRYGYDVMPEEWRAGEPGESAAHRYSVRYSACMFALALTELIHDERVDLLFDTVASEPVMDGGRCRGLIVENKSGRSFYEAGVVVDATGDADILFRAGVPTVQGLNYFTYSAYGIDVEHCRRAAETGRIEKAVFDMAGGRANLYGKNHPEGHPFYTGTSGEDVTRYLIDNQLELLHRIGEDDRASREVISMPGMCQFRTTRHIDGDYTLRQADVYRHFEDSVTAVCDFEHKGDFLWEVPYRALVRTGFDNLITAGRTVAAEDYAWDVMRVIPPAIVTGQAAGLAAAQALEQDRPIHAIDVGLLQRTLEKQNVLLHYDDAWAKENREDVMRFTKLDAKGGAPYVAGSHDGL
ncbi:MAG: FAD-dependent oxidoreductase [Clostridia bacterium]|nr:FAD-dependent oxidoreductase [Clostridia bacterium]